MTVIVVRSKRGTLTLEVGDQDLLWTADELSCRVAQIFGYSALLNGSFTYRLIDWNDTPMHPLERVHGGEYTLLVD